MMIYADLTSIITDMQKHILKGIQDLSGEMETQPVKHGYFSLVSWFDKRIN